VVLRLLANGMSMAQRADRCTWSYSSAMTRR
jgi:hypothetical protein